MLTRYNKYMRGLFKSLTEGQRLNVIQFLYFPNPQFIIYKNGKMNNKRYHIYIWWSDRHSVNNNFLPSSKVNSYVYILRLIFNSYFQLFITIPRLTTVEHFRVYNRFSYCLFQERIFQHAPSCSSYEPYYIHFQQVTTIYISPGQIMPSLSIDICPLPSLSKQSSPFKRTIIKRYFSMLTFKRFLTNLFWDKQVL